MNLFKQRKVSSLKVGEIFEFKDEKCRNTYYGKSSIFAITKEKVCGTNKIIEAVPIDCESNYLIRKHLKRKRLKFNTYFSSDVKRMYRNSEDVTILDTIIKKIIDKCDYSKEWDDERLERFVRRKLMMFDSLNKSLRENLNIELWEDN